MTSILAIDPGLRHCGICVLTDGVIEYAGLVKNTVTKERGPEAWRAMGIAVAADWPLGVDYLVCEYPQVYRGAYSKGDPADLIELAGVVGAITVSVLSEKQIGFLPKQWKGSVPKDVHHRRLRAQFTEADLQEVEWPAASLAHNVWDSIGLAVFYHKKLNALSEVA